MQEQKLHTTYVGDTKAAAGQMLKAHVDKEIEGRRHRYRLNQITSGSICNIIQYKICINLHAYADM